MDRLRATLDSGAGGHMVVLHGLGGCGKTTLAHALFQHAISDAADRAGLWATATDTASLRNGMLAVAADRGADEGELTAARAGLRAAADLAWDHLDRSDPSSDYWALGRAARRPRVFRPVWTTTVVRQRRPRRGWSGN